MEYCLDSIPIEHKGKIYSLVGNRKNFNKDDLGELDFIDEEEVRFSNLDKTIGLLLRSIVDNANIAILFDTDVDGVCAGSIIYKYIKRLYRTPLALINKTKIHGLSNYIFDECTKNDIDLLIVVDAGTNDYEYQERFNSAGIDIIVLDHHEIDDTDKYESDNTAIINCKDGVYKNRELSGAGVVYKFCEGLESKLKVKDSKLDTLSEYVGISIISDFCSTISRENRFFINKLYTSKAFSPFTSSFLKYGITQQSFSFGLVPAINSMIRVGNSIKAKDVFLTNSIREIELLKSMSEVSLISQRKIVNLIKDSLNVRLLDNFCFDDITGKAIKVPMDIKRNFTGLIATAVREEFGKSTLITFRDSGNIRGSFRGTNDYDYKKVFNKGGIRALGHNNVFGIVTNKEEFSKGMRNVLENLPESKKEVDWDIEMTDMDMLRSRYFLQSCALFNEFSGKNLDKIRIKVEVNKRFLNVDYYERYYKFNLAVYEVIGFSRAKIEDAGDSIIVTPTLNSIDSPEFKLIIF